MMKNTNKRARHTQCLIVLGLGAGVAVALPGCNGDSGGPVVTPTPTASASPTPAGGVVTASFDFNAGAQGWASDVSDLPASYSNALYEISYAQAALPAPLDTSRRALRLTSFNQSDDLWQFVKRQVGGLRPGTRYRVRFQVELASNAPESSFGVGGSPGASVYVKAGASAQEPQVLVQGGGRVFSLDKGNNSSGGRDALVLGTVGIPGEEFVYRLKSLDSGSRSFEVTSDSAGRAWAFVGTDSGYEGRQTLYYTRFTLTFTPA